MFKIFRRSMCVVNHKAKESVPIGVVGAPFCKGTGKVASGVHKGPSAFRKFGLVDGLRSLGLDIKDFGDLHFSDIHEEVAPKGPKLPLNVSAACQVVCKQVEEIHKEGRRCLTIGGDHSLGMATVYGHAQVRKDICVLWVDAHADINTELTSLSGHVHGMPCSFLIKGMEHYHSKKSAFSWVEPCIGRDSIAYIGLHDLDPIEKQILHEQHILYFTMADIDRLGIIEVTNKALDAINPTGKKSIHVSFDVDSLDKSISTCTTIPLHGGLTLREVLCLAEEVTKRGVPMGIDVVEIDPAAGTEKELDATLTITYKIIRALLGYPRDVCAPY